MAKRRTKTAKSTQTKVDSQLLHVVAPLRQIANTFGFLALRQSDVKDMTDTDQILFLSRMGFDPHSIAAIVDTTVNTVRVRRSEAKAQQSRKPAQSEQ